MPLLRRTRRIGQVRLGLLAVLRVLPVRGRRRCTVGLLLAVTLLRRITLLPVALLGWVGLLAVTRAGLRLLPGPRRRLLLLLVGRGRRVVLLRGWWCRS